MCKFISICVLHELHAREGRQSRYYINPIQIPGFELKMSGGGRRRAQSTSKTEQPAADMLHHSPSSLKTPPSRLPAIPDDHTLTTAPSLHEINREGNGVTLRMIGNYIVEKTIGRGQFGKVKLAYHKKLPDMKVCFLFTRNNNIKKRKKIPSTNNHSSKLMSCVIFTSTSA